MKKINVGIGGIPIDVWYDDKFVKGLTDDIRTKTIDYILAECKKDGHQNVIVSDIGEFLDKNPVTLTKLDSLGEQFKFISEYFDILGIYGVNHLGAYILYYVPGKVERFDAHKDDHYEDGMTEDDISGGNHMYYVFKKGLKLKSEVIDHAIVHIKVINGAIVYIVEDHEKFIAGLRRPYTGKIFDIDVDAHRGKYIKTADRDLQGLGPFTLRDFRVAIREAKPNIIGIFEYHPNNTKRGEMAIMSLMYEAVKAKLIL